MAEESYLAKPCGTCCIKGAIHDGDPQGSIVTVAGVQTYVARPAECKTNGNIVLYFPDIHALGKNCRLLMDSYASAGYLVLALDYFRGVCDCFQPNLLTESINYFSRTTSHSIRTQITASFRALILSPGRISMLLLPSRPSQNGSMKSRFSTENPIPSMPVLGEYLWPQI